MQSIYMHLVILVCYILVCLRFFLTQVLVSHCQTISDRLMPANRREKIYQPEMYKSGHFVSFPLQRVNLSITTVHRLDRNHRNMFTFSTVLLSLYD